LSLSVDGGTGVILRERVLAIVTILARYFLEDRDFLSETELVEELLSVGFEADEIDAAFSWMQGLSTAAKDADETFKPTTTQRIFTAEENRLLTQEARGFLIRMRSLGLLDDLTQEEVIDRAFQLGEDSVSIKELKVITALSLFARTNEDWRREVDCLLAEDWSRLFN